MRQNRRRLGISRYDRVRRVVLRIGALRSGRYGILRSVVMGHVELWSGALCWFGVCYGMAGMAR